MCRKVLRQLNDLNAFRKMITWKWTPPQIWCYVKMSECSQNYDIVWFILELNDSYVIIVVLDQTTKSNHYQRGLLQLDQIPLLEVNVLMEWLWVNVLMVDVIREINWIGDKDFPTNYASKLTYGRQLQGEERKKGDPSLFTITSNLINILNLSILG